MHIGAISLLRFYRETLSRAALSYSGLLTALCKFCLQPAGVAGKNGTGPPPPLPCECPQCALMPLALQKCDGVSNETPADVFSPLCIPEVADYGNFPGTRKAGGRGAIIKNLVRHEVRKVTIPSYWLQLAKI